MAHHQRSVGALPAGVWATPADDASPCLIGVVEPDTVVGWPFGTKICGWSNGARSYRTRGSAVRLRPQAKGPGRQPGALVRDGAVRCDQSFSIFRDHRSVEAVVQAGADDVEAVGNVGVEAGREARLAQPHRALAFPSVDVKIFELRRPVGVERGFGATAKCPAGPGIAAYVVGPRPNELIS